MASQVPPKKNTAFVFYAYLVSQADTNIFQTSATLAEGDVKVAIDDGDPANLDDIPVVDANFTKRIKVTLTAAEMNGDVISVLFSDAAGAEWCDASYQIHTTSVLNDDLPTAAENADAVVDEVFEGSLTIRQALRIFLAVLAGKSTGGGSVTVNFRDNADSKARVTATVDANGNRSSVTLDGT